MCSRTMRCCASACRSTAFDDFRARRPAAAEVIVRNLAKLLAHRLLQANTKIDLLSAN